MVMPNVESEICFTREQNVNSTLLLVIDYLSIHQCAVVEKGNKRPDQRINDLHVGKVLWVELGVKCLKRSRQKSVCKNSRIFRREEVVEGNEIIDSLL